MMSLRARFAAVHLAQTVVVLAILAIVGYWVVSRGAYTRLDAALLELAETEAGFIARGDVSPVHVHDPSPEARSLSWMRLGRVVQIVDADGALVARSTNLAAARLPLTPGLREAVASGRPVFETRQEPGGEPIRMVTLPASIGTRHLAVQVAGSLGDTIRYVESTGLILLALGLAVLVAIGFTGSLLTRRVFRAIDRVVRMAPRIDETNLGERLPHPGTDDEIGRLVDTLNGMLERIQRSFDAQKRFTAYASHELKSPLSRLRVDLELSLRRPRSDAEYVTTLKSCLQETERLSVLADELLYLARLDAGFQQGQAEAVNVAELATGVVERLQSLARERGMSLVLAPSPTARAWIARSALDLVLANVVENAVKYSSPGGEITIRVSDEGDRTALSVSDSGPGIPAEELQLVFDRFYRGAAASASETPGAGLGLAMCKAIVDIHGGSISASSLPGRGTVVTIRLPSSAAAALTPRRSARRAARR